MTQAAYDYDICILGAGLAGAALANLISPLADRGWSIGLLDRADFVPPEQSDAATAVAPLVKQSSKSPAKDLDGRATALSFGSQQILQQAGLWQALDDHACSIQHIEVSDQGRFGQAHLHASEQASEALGYIVENHFFGQSLISALANTKIQCLPGQQVQSATAIHGGYQLAFADDRMITTRLLIIADGGRSPMLQQLGIDQQQTHYGAHAIVTQVRTNQSHDHWAYERFSEHGPIAFLPLSKQDYAVVWTVAEDQLDDTLRLSDGDFLKQLQQRIGYRVGRLQQVGERFQYPLALVRASEQIRPNLALIGNAAHSLHPVAGQGFNLTLRDIAQLAAILSEVQQRNGQPGVMQDLQRYQAAQQQDQQVTIAASDWLPRLFSQRGRWLQRSRDIGLMALAAAPTARRLFTRHAMGMGQPAAAVINTVSQPQKVN